MSKAKEAAKVKDTAELPKSPKTATHVVTVNDVYEAFWAANTGDGESAPEFGALPEVAQDAYAAGVAHVSAGNDPRTKFEQFVVDNKSKFSVTLKQAK